MSAPLPAVGHPWNRLHDWLPPNDPLIGHDARPVKKEGSNGAAARPVAGAGMHTCGFQVRAVPALVR